MMPTSLKNRESWAGCIKGGEKRQIKGFAVVLSVQKKKPEVLRLPDGRKA
jgi:hypothetical protein